MIWAVSLLTMDLSTHCLTPEKHVYGIRSLTRLGNPWRAPHPISALPPRRSYLEASPKAISGRTSYLRVRLEFLRYPQLIPALFNVRGFGPPLHFTATSTCPGVDHPVSGLRPRTFALFRRAFATAPASHLNLARDRNSPVHSTKGTPSGMNALRLIVGTRFQVLFHSAPAVLFTFPSRYWFTIGRQVVFSLRRWSSLIPTGFLVSRSTWGIVSESAEFRIRDFHPLRSAF